MLNSLSRINLLCLVALAAAGCSTVSEMYSQKNPKWEGQPARKVMVVGDFSNLVYRKDAEQEMCDEMSEVSSTRCFRSLDYVFAGNEEGKNITAAMNKLQIDAMIYVSNLKSGADIVSTPTISTATWRSGLLTSIGIGGTQSVNWSNYSVTVYTPSGDAIWTGSVNAGGDKDDFIEDTSEEVVSKLVNDGIIDALNAASHN